MDDEDIPDTMICPRGQFNKLIEVLCVTQHPDAQINFTTMEYASRKLPIIVSQNLAEYLTHQQSILSDEAYRLLYHQLQQDGLDVAGVTAVIFPTIKQAVNDEFGVLFPHDRDLENFVSCSLDVDIKSVLNQFPPKEILTLLPVTERLSPTALTSDGL